MSRRFSCKSVAWCAFLWGVLTPGWSAETHDWVIRGGNIYDGSGGQPYAGDVAVDGDRIVYVGPTKGMTGRQEINAAGQAVAPGFINMLSHVEESIMVDGRALSDLTQGVTLEVLGEDSMGPLNPTMKTLLVQRQADIHYPVTWSTLGEYLEQAERRGIGPNIASFVGAPAVRTFVLGENNVQPTPRQLDQMRELVRQAMEEGALGVTTMLIYEPASYARTEELTTLARVAAQCGGIYTAHIRNEGDRIEQAIAETVDIARSSGAPAEIYHFKLDGKDNWNKFDRAVGSIEQARSRGIRITANMYTYIASATGFDAAMPAWVQEGGLEKWIERLKDPAIRARVIAEMRDPHPADWDSAYAGAGPDGVLLLGFKNPKLKPLTGRRLSNIARERGASPEDTIVDLVIEDGSRVEVAYFGMDEANIRREVQLPWMSFGSDEGGLAPEGVFLLSSAHPRAYGNFARLLAKYVREEKLLSLQEAVRRLSSLPADNLSLKDRGRLKAGEFADLVVFDPATIQDHATFDKPHQLSTGVSNVMVNGRLALKDGRPTGAATGRFVRGRAWIGAPGGGCRASAAVWSWAK